MINSRTRLSIILAALLLGAALFVGGPALAQSWEGCPNGAGCIDASTFDSDTDGWEDDHASVEWMSYKTLGMDLANGILHIYDPLMDAGRNSDFAPGAYKSFYLQPGIYQVRVKAGQDISFILNSFGIQVRGSDIALDSGGDLNAWWYTEYTSAVFTVAAPTQIRIQISSNISSYFDYIYLEKLEDDYPTPIPTVYGSTPTPGGPTYTPSPTYVPTDQQATPLPVGTAVCKSGSPAATAGIPAYATPTQVVTNTLARLESFNYGSIDLIANWSRTGTAYVKSGADHTGDGSNAGLLQYDPHWDESSMSEFDNSLILEAGFGYEIWVNAWAQADVVPLSQTAKIEIWELIDSTWEIAGSESISAQNWYPVHVAISSTASRIAFVAVRSDTPSAGYALLDDVYIYAPESNMPYCSGYYPSNTTSMSGDSLGVPGNDSFQLLYPGDKACPAGIMRPNNLWGMILAQLTLFLDGRLAFSPAHIIGTTRDLAQQFILGPIGGLIVMGTVVFDWNIPLIAMGIYIAFQSGLAIVGIWKVIRRAFIV